jgi:hypothetical protein
MRQFQVRIVGGILLIAAGALFLLQNFGIFAVGDYLWPFLFGAGGLVFLYVFLTDRANWWAIIPGFTLLGLAAMKALDQLIPQIGETWGAALFLGGIGLAFWVVYFTNREHWWAVIPGGVLFTIALVAGLSSILEGIETGGVFFLGLGLTFALLSFLPTPEGRMKWALIPAGVLLVMGLLITAAATAIINYLWPAALILGGIYLLFRAFGFRQSE